jgi:hypothetical protein
MEEEDVDEGPVHSPIAAADGDEAEEDEEEEEEEEEARSSSSRSGPRPVSRPWLVVVIGSIVADEVADAAADDGEALEDGYTGSTTTPLIESDSNRNPSAETCTCVRPTLYRSRRTRSFTRWKTFCVCFFNVQCFA